MLKVPAAGALNCGATKFGAAVAPKLKPPGFGGSTVLPPKLKAAGFAAALLLLPAVAPNVNAELLCGALEPKFVAKGVLGFVELNILGVCEFTTPKAGLAEAPKPPKPDVAPVVPPKAFVCFSVDAPNVGVEGIPKGLGVSCFVAPNAVLGDGNVGVVVTGLAPKPVPKPIKG